MKKKGSASLKFDPDLQQLREGKELRNGLSAVVKVGDTLWLANDEALRLERLSLKEEDSHGGTYKYGKHTVFSLDQYLQLPAPPSTDLEDIEEADLEGLAYHDGYLWLIGSHSLKRKSPEPDQSLEENFQELAKVKTDDNRFLLARIPLDEETLTLEKEIDQGDQKRTAARLRGDARSSDLTDALAEDEHLKPFLSIPSKDNGFDIEGLATTGDRLFIGLRGPVLRGWAVILEVELDVSDGMLTLKPIGPGDRPYRKHFLNLGGLGVRELEVWRSDLLILAGPTMELDGPVAIFQWKGGAQPDGESLVDGDRLRKIKSIPFGQGVDHAEGMTLFSTAQDAMPSVLIVYDSSSEDRKTGSRTLKADIFSLHKCINQG